MTRIWVVKDPRKRRHRKGKLYYRRTVCLQRDDLILKGQEVSSSNGPLSYHVFPLEAYLLKALMLRQGIIFRDEMFDILWPNPDFEPEAAEKSIDQHVFRLRAVLNPLGWNIICEWGRGFLLQRTMAIQVGCKARERSVQQPEQLVVLV